MVGPARIALAVGFRGLLWSQAARLASWLVRAPMENRRVRKPRLRSHGSASGSGRGRRVTSRIHEWAWFLLANASCVRAKRGLRRSRGEAERPTEQLAQDNCQLRTRE